jgi:tripartite-type tricarboxylate transporter receptor subunit TctC
MFDSIPSASAHIRAGTLRPLAVSSPQRLPYLPEVPTFAEVGYPRLVASNWFGRSAPAETPQPVIARLSRALNEALATPTLSSRLAEIGFDVLPMNPAEFTRFVGEQLAFWSDIVRRAQVTAN